MYKATTTRRERTVIPEIVFRQMPVVLSVHVGSEKGRPSHKEPNEAADGLSLIRNTHGCCSFDAYSRKYGDMVPMCKQRD